MTSSPAVAAAPAHELAPQLASVYSGQVEPARCFVSEKHDGVRALWDGRVLRHRSGRTVAAPASFLAALPLDGELWLGRGRFDALSATVRRVEPGERDWAAVRYMVFDVPVAGPSFADRLARLAVIAPSLRRPVEVAPQWRVADRSELERTLARTVAAGGEGLMLHVADAAYVPGRRAALLKVEALPRCRADRRRPPRRHRQIPSTGRRARGRIGAGTALLHRQRPQRCRAPRPAGDRHDGHLPLSRADADRAVALRDLPAAYDEG